MTIFWEGGGLSIRDWDRAVFFYVSEPPDHFVEKLLFWYIFFNLKNFREKKSFYIWALNYDKMITRFWNVEKTKKNINAMTFFLGGGLSILDEEKPKI